MVEIMEGDCLEKLRLLPDESVHCCVTSPPYWGLRDYGVAGQIGLEPTPQEYVSKMVAVFAELRRVLRQDGTLWLNLGDSYGAGGRTGGQPGNTVHNGELHGQAQVRNTLRNKDLCGIPWRVAFALQADGWYLRSDIIWHKPNPMPESVTDRPTKSHEYIFLLSKSERYYYDAEAVKERGVCDKLPGRGMTDTRLTYGAQNGGNSGLLALRNRLNDKARTKGKWSTEDSQSSGHRIVEGVAEARANGANHDSPFGETRNKRSVWTVPTAPYFEAHFATFPPDLIKPCILAGCPVGGTVLDPFGGSGTTGQVALELGRKAILIELNPKYIELAKTRTFVTPGFGF